MEKDRHAVLRRAMRSEPTPVRLLTVKRAGIALLPGYAFNWVTRLSTIWHTYSEEKQISGAATATLSGAKHEGGYSYT